MKLKEFIGDYDDIKGGYSRSQHFLRELTGISYVLLLVVSIIRDYRILLLFLIALLPVDIVVYRLSVIRRLHDLDVPKEEVNTTFWKPFVSYRVWWRLLFERGRK